MAAAWNLAAHTVQAGGVVDYQPILVVLVGMTTATITGVFVFMTFRIDRGTQQEAERVANETLEKMKNEVEADVKKMKESVNIDIKRMEESAYNELVKMINESNRSLGDTKRSRDLAIDKMNSEVNGLPLRVDKAIGEEIDKEVTTERIREQIADRVTEERLREHVKSVLMVTANGQIVAEYAKEHAEVLESQGFKQLIHLLDDIIRPLSPNDPPERDSRGVGWWRRLRAYFTRRHSSRREQGEHK